jgi:hypothetical protein
MYRLFFAAVLLYSVSIFPVQALERPGVEYKIFQFPSDMIPTIDGKTDDWKIVGDEYVVGSDQLSDTVKNHGTNIDPKNFNCKVRVGWVKGLNRLYFLYEAYDNFWKFDTNGLVNDIFEIVVDGDLSGGPVIPEMRTDMKMNFWDGYLFQGVMAQNYHIFTPAKGKDWCMEWGSQQYTKDMPWANHAYSYNFKNGEGGKLVLEFWITPFDYAPYDITKGIVESKLKENSIIGLSWSVLDYDADNIKEGDYTGFNNLSHKTTMYGDASALVAFRLMPLGKQFHKPLEVNWTFTVVDMDRRLVSFKDLTYGKVTSWKWDFGDGTTSTEQNPVHQYAEGGYKIVVLYVEGPDGKDKFSRVWDVTLK